MFAKKLALLNVNLKCTQSSHLMERAYVAAILLECTLRFAIVLLSSQEKGQNGSEYLRRHAVSMATGYPHTIIFNGICLV